MRTNEMKNGTVAYSQLRLFFALMLYILYYFAVSTEQVWMRPNGNQARAELIAS